MPKEKKREVTRKERGRPPTLNDVAAEAELAVSTVSMILNGKATSAGIAKETIQRVQATANEMGYIPNRHARNLRLRQTGLIGVLLGGLRHEAPSRLIAGLRSELEKHEEPLLPLVASHDYDEKRLLEQIMFFAQQGVEAVICQPWGKPEHYNALVSRKIPLIFVQHDLSPPVPEAHGVYFDTGPLLEMALKYLSEKGSKKIAFLGWDYHTPFSVDKVEAFTRTMAKFKLSHPKKWTFMAPSGSDIAPSIKNLLSSSDPPDTLMCSPYEVALAAQAAVDKYFPDSDCRIFSLSDNPFCNLERISITAIDVDHSEIGRTAAKVLRQALQDRNLEPEKIMLSPYRLHERKSTTQ